MSGSLLASTFETCNKSKFSLGRNETVGKGPPKAPYELGIFLLVLDRDGHLRNDLLCIIVVLLPQSYADVVGIL